MKINHSIQQINHQRCDEHIIQNNVIICKNVSEIDCFIIAIDDFVSFILSAKYFFQMSAKKRKGKTVSIPVQSKMAALLSTRGPLGAPVSP